MSEVTAAFATDRRVIAVDLQGHRRRRRRRVPLTYLADFYRLLGGGLRDPGWDGSARPAHQLAILPNTTHYDVLTSPVLLPIARTFLSSGRTARNAPRAPTFSEPKRSLSLSKGRVRRRAPGPPANK